MPTSSSSGLLFLPLYCKSLPSGHKIWRKEKTEEGRPHKAKKGEQKELLMDFAFLWSIVVQYLEFLRRDAVVRVGNQGLAGDRAGLPHLGGHQHADRAEELQL